MRLSPPKQITFWIATILALLGFLGFMGFIAGLNSMAFWLVFVGFVILWLGNLVKGL